MGLCKIPVQFFQIFRPDWFLNNEFADFGRPVENYFLCEQLPDGFIESKEVQQQVVDYFSAFDPSIIGFEVETVERGDDKRPSKVRIDAVHKMIDSNATATIPLKLESAGTLKMFALYPLLQEVLETGGVTKCGLPKKRITAYRCFIHWPILSMKTARKLEKTKTMKRTIFWANMAPSLL